jgi:hypothetical protein
VILFIQNSDKEDRMNVDDVFRGIKGKMLIDFDQISNQVEHRPSKGKIRENEIINEFLVKYLPSNIGISNGEIISVDNQVSRETDIVLYEKGSTPYLLKTESYQVFPIECVYGVIEVKSFLDKDRLYDAFQNISRVKKMPKEAYVKPISPLHSLQAYDKTWMEFFPTFGFVIAFDSIDLLTLKKHLETFQNDIPNEHRLDSIYVLKKGMIVNANQNNGGIDLLPSSQSRLAVFGSDNPLLSLTIQIQALCSAAWTSKFDIRQYVKDMPIGIYLG